MRLLEIPMHRNDFKLIAFVLLVQLCLWGVTRQAPAQAEKTASPAMYSAMGPVNAYLIADQNTEIALARSAAPASISDGAEVMVLGEKGFTTAVKGTNDRRGDSERADGECYEHDGVWCRVETKAEKDCGQPGDNHHQQGKWDSRLLHFEKHAPLTLP